MTASYSYYCRFGEINLRIQWKYRNSSTHNIVVLCKIIIIKIVRPTILCYYLVKTTWRAIFSINQLLLASPLREETITILWQLASTSVAFITQFSLLFFLFLSFYCNLFHNILIDLFTWSIFIFLLPRMFNVNNLLYRNFFFFFYDYCMERLFMI